MKEGMRMKEKTDGY